MVGCTAKMDEVEPIKIIKDGTSSDTGSLDINQPRGTETDAGQDGIQPPLDALTDNGATDAGTDTSDADGAEETPDGVQPELDASMDEGGAADDGIADDGETEIPDGTQPELDASSDDDVVDNGFTDDDVVGDSETDVPDGIQPELDASTDEGVSDIPDGIQPDIDATIDADQVDAAEADACVVKKSVCTAGPGAIVKKDEKGNEYIEVTANKGEIANVPFLMTGTNYTCDNPALGAQELPGESTLVYVKYSADTTTVFDPTCTAFYYCGNNGNVAPCPPVKINVKVKPTLPPVVKNPTLKNPYPSGNGCFKGSNSMTANWSASTSSSDPLICVATLKDIATSQDVASVQISQLPSNTMSADIPITNGNVLPFRDYALSVFCEDSFGQKGSSTSNPILTYYKETLLFHRFLDGAGTTATDSGPLQLNGKVVAGTPQWLMNGGIHFDGKTMISVPKPAVFKSLNEVSMLIVFKPTIIPQINASSVMAAVSSNAVVDSWGMEIAKYSYPKFLITHNNSPVGNAASPNILSANATYSFLGIQQSGVGTSLHEGDGPKWLLSASTQNYIGPFISGDGGDISIGCWNNGTLCYTGDIYKVAIIGKNILGECK
jgi:hypothetical protein